MTPAGPYPQALSPGALDLLVFSRGLGPGAGGLEMFNSNLINILVPRWTVVQVPQQSSQRLLDYFLRVVNTARVPGRDRNTIVLVQYGSFLDIIAVLLLRFFFRRIAVIAHVSDTWWHLRNRFARSMTMAVLKHCTYRVFVLADQQTHVFAAVHPIKIHTIIGPAFAENSMKPAKRDGFAFLGRVVPEKGILDLIAAWSDSRLVTKKLKLNIHGSVDQAMSAKIQKLIVNRGLENLVTLHGPATGDDAVKAIMDHSTALLYPSYADAFPLVMIECFARGTPCLVSTVGEGSSFVQNPDLVVSPGDTEGIIQSVLKLSEGRISQAYLATMQGKARRFASGEIRRDLEQHDVLI